MEPSTSKPVDTSRIKIKEPIENPFENRPKSTRKKQLPISECKKILPLRSNCQVWIASNEKYLQSKAEKEAKRKRKREEKKSPVGRLSTNNKNEDKGKEEVVDVEQESEMNERLEKQKQADAEKKVKNKGKEKVVDVQDESEMNERVQKQSFNKVLKGRATVRPLFETMRRLTPQRKRVVREMGFGNLIDFPIVEIPTKLAFYVVDILNTRKMTLECPMGDIVITPKIVKEVLGLPMGRRKLEREGQREYNDPFLEEWKDQFKNINKLTIKALSDLIIDTKNTDYMFRMNILTLIANTLGRCENSSSLKFTVLRNLFEGDDASDVLDEILDDVGEKEENEEKEPKTDPNRTVHTPTEYQSSSSTESDDDDDDNSQVGDDNEKSYGTQTDLVEEDHVQIVIEAQQEERNNLQYTDEENDEKGVSQSEDEVMKAENTECCEKKDEEETGTSKKDEANNNKEEDNSLQGSQPTFDLGASPTYEKMKILSEKKKKMGLKSKYVNKTVDPVVELTKDEKLLGRSIFSTQQEEEMNIQSLAPGLEIDTSVIDVYVSILNYEEKFKMPNMKRNFFYTSMMVPGILEDKTIEIDKKIDAQYDRFHEMLSIQMEDDIEKMQMEDVELLYEGPTAAQWKTGLLLENGKNHRMQMDNLRSRIEAKILLHEVNVY
ncbi:hypothetical protein Tco_1523363 [Tanacetum coccineum]